ncbi:MAG: aminotransferase class V-fold PLP-dependent enzyme [Burkholderiales bacterium]|nr:aminotransferase class V-fold PLP-dependent enzyme [Burkholderiales bacterium]
MKKTTRIPHAGGDNLSTPHIVNPPVHRASTVLFDSVAHMHAVQAQWEKDDPDHPSPTYGITDMPNQVALQNALAELEGGYRAQIYSSGLAAVTGALLAFTKAGDHVLYTDSAYGPGRRAAQRLLQRFGVEVEFYDPLIGATSRSPGDFGWTPQAVPEGFKDRHERDLNNIRKLIRPNTTVVYCESPGSYTFEIQDVPAIAEVAHANGATVLIDNAWATGFYFNAFAHGADVVIQPVTKYIAGHSDLLMGAVIANERAWPRLRETTLDLGQTAGPDDLFNALRGLRTLGVRLPRHYETAMKVTQWLQTRPEVARVLYPALPGDPGHALWKRDFTGATGLFSVELKPVSDAQIAAMIDHYELFKIGYSWGGYESLAMPAHLSGIRSVNRWTGGPLVRFHVGLEDAGDLIADLEAGFRRLVARST